MSSGSSYCSNCSDDSYDSCKEQLQDVIPQLLEDLGIQYQNLAYCGGGQWAKVFQFDQVDKHTGSPSADEKESITEAVIRIVTIEDTEKACAMTKSLVATLNFASPRLPFVPKVLQFDTTLDNVVERPYTIQTRLPGEQLEAAWEKMDIEAKCCVAEELADFSLACESIPMPIAGQLGGLEVTRSSVPSAAIYDFTAETPTEIDALSYSPSHFVSLYDFCQHHLSYHVANPMERAGWGELDEQIKCERLLQKFQSLVQRLNEVVTLRQYSTINANETVLHHNDLHPGNVLVTRTISEEGVDQWHLSGIVDWDAAYCVPKVLARQKLAFLWQKKFWGDEWPTCAWNGDLDFLPEELANDYDEHGAVIRARLNEYTKKKLIDTQGHGTALSWYEDSYLSGILMRKIAYFALNGYDGYWRNVEVLEQLVDELQSRVPDKDATIDSRSARNDTCDTHLSSTEKSPAALGLKSWSFPRASQFAVGGLHWLSSKAHGARRIARGSAAVIIRGALRWLIKQPYKNIRATYQYMLIEIMPAWRAASQVLRKRFRSMFANVNTL